MKRTKAVLDSDTMIFRVHKYVPKWTLWEETEDNGTRKYFLEYQKEHGAARTVDLKTPVMTAKLRYMRDYQPELLQELLNSGKLYLYLLRLNGKVEKAIDRQMQLWQETDKEYLAAADDFLKQFAILQRFRMEAEHMLFETMVYV